MKRLLLATIVIAASAIGSAQPRLFTDALPPEEFAARRARVLERIGDGVVVMQGATETTAYEAFRQSNQFFYLTGVEVARAILVLDGRTKTSTLYLSPRNERMERSEGPVLTPGPEAVALTGMNSVLPRDEFVAAAKSMAGRTIYTTFRGETGSAGTPDREASHAAARKSDPWDNQPSREEWFRTKLAEQAAGAKFENVDPILDEMRLVKSAREIELVRRATRIAGEGIMEAMRSARPGMYEYELGEAARSSLGHMVGMEVHDVTVPFDALKPGMIFTIEPALTIPQDRVYIRLEDVILITASGYENMSDFVPMDVAGIEKLMAEKGIADAVRK